MNLRDIILIVFVSALFTGTLIGYLQGYANGKKDGKAEQGR